MSDTTERPARCYHEFCCYPAKYELHDHGNIPGNWIGVWGFCAHHKPKESNRDEWAL